MYQLNSDNENEVISKNGLFLYDKLPPENQLFNLELKIFSKSSVSFWFVFLATRSNMVFYKKVESVEPGADDLETFSKKDEYKNTDLTNNAIIRMRFFTPERSVGELFITNTINYHEVKSTKACFGTIDFRMSQNIKNLYNSIEKDPLTKLPNPVHSTYINSFDAASSKIYR